MLHNPRHNASSNISLQEQIASAHTGCNAGCKGAQLCPGTTLPRRQSAFQQALWGEKRIPAVRTIPLRTFTVCLDPIAEQPQAQSMAKQQYKNCNKSSTGESQYCCLTRPVSSTK